MAEDCDLFGERLSLLFTLSLEVSLRHLIKNVGFFTFLKQEPKNSNNTLLKTKQDLKLLDYVSFCLCLKSILNVICAHNVYLRVLEVSDVGSMSCHFS